jgi:hypothetical protein
MSTQLDADLASTMTPEELEAINAEDTPEEKMIMRQAPEGDDGDDDDDGDEDAAPVEGKTEAKPETKPEAQPEEPAEAKAEEPEEEAPAAAPRYEARLPSDYDDQIKALKARDAELRQQFKDGEIDIDARDEELAALSEQREKLLVLRAKAEISQEMTEQTAQSQWQTEINKAINRAAKEDGIDYRKDQAKAQDWDQFVRILAAKPEHADKSMDWFLAEAHKRVMALHGVAQAPKRETIDDAKAKRKPPVGAVPKTLAQVPGSDGPGDVGGEFADVEALDGWDLEQAIARMTPAQREKFVRGG